MRVADYIHDGGWWEEAETGIIFKDCNINHNTSLRHHFRSSCIKDELKRLDDHWKKCLAQPECIPAKKIKSVNSSGDILIKPLNKIGFLKDFHIEIKHTIDTAGYSGKETNLFPKFQPHSKQDTRDKMRENEVPHEEKGSQNAEIISVEPVANSQIEITNFKTKTATYIYKAIPEHENLIQVYDNTRAQSFRVITYYRMNF